ncbi:hypothetical protein M885DRAFT_538592 [Pelagophyceae sp. CCMP2097]|nr:hypothetical protein M885DRAFT_538592 [Pelagophyceae sp. CCMP2097]
MVHGSGLVPKRGISLCGISLGRAGGGDLDADEPEEGTWMGWCSASSSDATGCGDELLQPSRSSNFGLRNVDVPSDACFRLPSDACFRFVKCDSARCAATVREHGSNAGAASAPTPHASSDEMAAGCAGGLCAAPAAAAPGNVRSSDDCVRLVMCDSSRYAAAVGEGDLNTGAAVAPTSRVSPDERSQNEMAAGCAGGLCAAPAAAAPIGRGDAASGETSAAVLAPSVASLSQSSKSLRSSSSHVQSEVSPSFACPPVAALLGSCCAQCAA